MIKIVLILFFYCNFINSDELIKQQQQYAIRISQQPYSQIAVRGSKVTFKCEYELVNLERDASDLLDDGVRVSWLFESNKNGIHKLTDANLYEFDRNSLQINSYNPNLNTGQYRCLINNTLHSPPIAVLSQPANLSLASIGDFDLKWDEEQIKLDLSEGNVAIISCKLPSSNPPAVPLFYLNHNLLTTSHVFSPFSLNVDTNRYKVFPSGNLQISNIKHSDSGVYTCAALNPITNEIRNSSRQTILKVYQPIGSKLPEIVYVPTEANRVQIGFNITLECVANGAPVPLVSWEKFGGILPDRRSQQIFGNLILMNVQLEDKGTYVCRAENGPGQATFKTAMIDVFESPHITDKIDTLTAKKGESIEMKCPIRARPRPDVQWFNNGVPLPPLVNPHYRISNIGDKSILVVENVQSSSVYQCYAQNEYGSAQADLFLTSYDGSPTHAPKRPVIIMGPQNTSIYEGQSVVLLCVTSETSSGSTQINWLQNDLIIEPTLMRRFEINQLLGNLRIVSVQKSDAGVYKCIASNEFGMSTAEAYVHVKTTTQVKNDEVKPIRKPAISPNKSPLPISASRPTVQQIGQDKILLKWHLIDQHGSSIDPTSDTNIAYFKVDYKTNKPTGGQSTPGNTWLTIDEQIDPKKREYILTDLSKYETYRFRITVFFLNGELNHSYQSSRFKLEPNWLNSQAQTTPADKSSTTKSQDGQFKLSDIQMQVTQLWAISTTSLGLKWDIQWNRESALQNKTAFLAKKINGFYIFYRKLDSSATNVPIYNYTRINVPISIVDTGQFQLQHLIDTYIIANLDEGTQYEIKMTCYNLNGDLCSFSNTIQGLTLDSVASSSQPSTIDGRGLAINSEPTDSTTKSKQNELVFMILGIVLGALTLLLVLFIVMYVVRQTQHKKLLAQLHNTSQKLTSSSCPTLIYEDSLRQTNQNHRHHFHHQQQPASYTTNKLVDTFLQNSTNDSNSTNSQSMSTTTSSMTTPPNIEPSHVLLLNGNTVSVQHDNQQQPPPIPQVPPPPIANQSSSTLNRININLNPLNGYLETNYLRNMSPLLPKANQMELKNQQENFYHTLTTLGTLPNTQPVDEPTNTYYADYNNSTLNMRAHLLYKQQQQQLIMNTLKNLNLKQKQQLLQIQEQCGNSGQLSNENPKSPSCLSMKRNNSANSSRRSKKMSKSNENNTENYTIQSPPQANYYLLPNVRPQQTFAMRNIYNEMDILTLEAALNQNNLSILNANGGGGVLLLNQPQFLNQTRSDGGNVPIIYGTGLFENQSQHACANSTNHTDNGTYEPSESNEQEPMLTNHYASSGIMLNNKGNQQEEKQEESQKLL